jgi:hypothetical protein
VLVLFGVLAAGALAFGPNARARNAGIATAAATLLIAPAAWSFETLGHATSRTGSTTAMAAVTATCKQIDADGVTLYDCQGQADAIAAAP